ncbi:LamG domain-containing protein, partial [Candidatus Pacearchaeota archaeon]|nr:LamG domain-containing protein [Candidatus Pacearchaeota archaeon]
LTQVATTTPLVKSSDGINFSTVTFPSSVTLTEGVALTGRGRVIVADDWTDLIWYSDDLTTWTSAATAGGGIYIQNMAWSPKLQIVVMVGFASAGFRLQWSDDLGLTWGAGSGTTEQPNGVTWSKERELFYMGRDQVFKSSDGKVWTGTSRTGTGTGGNTPWCDDLGIALSFGSSGDTAIYSKDDFTTNTLIPGINATHTFTKKMVTYSSKRGEILAITSSPGGIFLRSKSITESKISETLTRTGTDLKPTNAGDTLTLDSSLYQPVFGDETGLILDIPFEEIGTAETQYDRSEKGYIFDSITGSPVVSATNGKYGSGVYLDGSASYEKAVVACPQGNEPISFELAFKGTTGLANGDALVSYGSADGQKSIFLFYQASSLYLQTYGSSLNLFDPMVLDTWYHVVATWDGTDGKLYMDGVLIGTDAAPPMVVTDNTIYIGDSAYHTKWTGNIDYAKVYNRVLTEDEIRTHYLRYGGNSVVKSDNFKVVDTNNNVNQIVDVNGTTLKDGSTATTQPTTDNSTKVASTAFVTAHETNGQWTRTGTDLAPTNVGDSVSTTGQLNIGDGTLDTEVALIQKDQDGQTLLRIKNANTGTDANTLVQVQSDGCGLNLRTYGTGSSSNPDAVAIDAFGNSGGLIIETDTKLTTRIGSTDRTEVTPEGLNVHDSVYQPVFADESTLIVDLPFKFYGTDETQYSSALDNIFTATGGVTSASTGGPQDGPNVHFDGTDDSLQCSNIDGLDFSTNEKLTVECWAKADEVTSARSIWTFHGTHGSYWEVFSLDISNANAVGLYFGDGIDGQAEGFVVSVDDVTTWHHYTATLDRVTNIMQLYVDDALANSITITGEDLAWTTPISLGLGGHVAKTTQWHGQVAEFKTYNKVLSSDEVRTHYIRQGGKSFIITDDFRIFGTDGTKHLEVDDNSLQYLDDNGSRFLIDISKVQLNTGNSAINVTDTDTTLYYAVEPRFVVDATKTMVASPDGTNTLEVDNSTATYNNNDIATQGDAVFELYSEADLPAPAAGISLLPSGKYIMKKAFSLAAIDEFQCFAGAVIEWTSEDKENHTLTHTEASKTLFNFGNSGGRLKIEHASFVLSGNNQTFINMTGKDFSSKINDFRVTF